MPKYYCDYCKSYLTHDTRSVRKSHLQGKNHIKYYCDYYEFKAKETGEWKPSNLIYEITLDKLNKGVPGGPDDKNLILNQNDQRKRNEDAMIIDMQSKNNNEDDDEEVNLPPPPHFTGLPNPPPSVYNNTREYQKAMFLQMRQQH
ncbi:uncharacterized protein KGF55_000707 [Candida pseudojiufengensis]|uniref:uncharacterized protein n=1 Tax=Candida pseudojiufengensis TaxID=497109 RepID=UPI00222408B3|nr:uncharacterized protein KGF55_000707 [Candida pseudojiufengensis]KAI5966398.1 hypothetical protein KGF55_000707 [Candida pseudojiufengensis]